MSVIFILIAAVVLLLIGGVVAWGVLVTVRHFRDQDRVIARAGHLIPKSALRRTRISLVFGSVIGVVGLVVAIIGTFQAFNALSPAMSGPSEVCKRTSDCCLKFDSPAACDKYLKAVGRYRDSICGKDLERFQRANLCP